MTHVSIIGTGNMGTAIAEVVTHGGGTVESFNSTQQGPLTGEIVVLAVPHAALAEIAETRGAELAGKVVVDVTNPVNFETFDSLTVPADSSAAAGLAEALPQSHVLKAFNTNFAGTLKPGTGSTTVFVAGDDSAAKDLLISVVAGVGSRPWTPGRCVARASSRPSPSWR